jgi:hypothetical protein
VTDQGFLTEEDVYELLAFLVTSAELLPEEPPLYGTVRCIQASSRLMGFVLESGRNDDQFLTEFKEYLDKELWLLFTDEEEAYIQFLKDASRKLARELVRRARQ